MSNIRDLGQKISSLKNMQKVTRAMNMISSIKLRKLYALQGSLEFYHQKIGEVKDLILPSLRESTHKAMTGYAEVNKVHLVMFTADKGLCGTHNSSVLRELNRFLGKVEKEGIAVEITSIGNKGTGYCRRKELDLFKSTEIAEKTFTEKDLSRISREIYERYLAGTVQKVYLVGNIFYSALQQETELKQLLPLIPEKADAETKPSREIQMEPSGDEMARSVGSLILKYRLNSYLYNSLLSEHSSRMNAMENATSNTEDLIGKYVTIQNHARQAAITNELIEIVSGKEALKG